MKKTLLLIIIVCCFMQGKAGAQNLVPNPSFEDTVACPNSPGQVNNRVVGWNSFNHTPDYMNSCADFSTYCSVPNGADGYQFAATGNAFCGLYSYVYIYEYREIIGAKLITPLIIGQKYFVLMKIVLGNSSGCATNNIGFLFSTVSYIDSLPFDGAPTAVPINNFSHFRTTNIIADTLEWHNISGSFIADSAYKYVIIGNFYHNDMTDTLLLGNINSCYAYYYIDDVCVSTDSLTCNPPVSIKETTANNSISIFPNPATSSINISFPGDNIKTITYTLSDILGRKIKQGALVSGGAVDVSDCSKGVYVLRLGSGEAEVCRKVVVQ